MLFSVATDIAAPVRKSTREFLGAMSRVTVGGTEVDIGTLDGISRRIWAGE